MIVAQRLDELRQGVAEAASERGLDDASGFTVATIGNFDGLHRGHQAIMQTVTERAAATGAIPAVVTFEPHPLRILAPQRAPRLLMTRDQKLGLLEEMGIAVVATLPFDRAMADMEPEAFTDDVVVDSLRARELFLGPDFRFGRARSGDVALLAEFGAEKGFRADSIEPVDDGGERISASRIRYLLSEGKPADAARLLGRPFRLIGTIVHGEGRGRAMLVPTANLSPENEFQMPHGVYVTQTLWDDESFFGLTNVGTRPTFGDHRTVVESFLPGFDGDLYGRRVELAFHDRLRDEKRFDSSEQLMAQIEQDLQQLRNWKRQRV